MYPSRVWRSLHTVLAALSICVLTMASCTDNERAGVAAVTEPEDLAAMSDTISASGTTISQIGAASPGLIHTVYFWLAKGLSDTERADFMVGLKSLGEVPSVRRTFIGPPASTPSRGVVDNSFDFAYIVWFDDVAGHDAYQVHPIHLKFVADHEAKFGEVRVHDNVLLD